MSFTLYARDNSSNCQKVIWLFKELGVQFELVPTGKGHAFNGANPEYRKLSPTGLVPLLRHRLPDGQDFWVDESNTILHYLCAVNAESDAARRLGGLSSPQHQARVSRWQDYAHTLEAANKPVYFHYIRGERLDDATLAEEKKRANEKWAVVDQQLNGAEYLANNTFSLAEITVGAQLHRYFTLDFAPRPQLKHLEALYGRLKQRPLFDELVVKVPFV